MSFVGARYRVNCNIIRSSDFRFPLQFNTADPC